MHTISSPKPLNNSSLKNFLEWLIDYILYNGNVYSLKAFLEYPNTHVESSHSLKNDKNHHEHEKSCISFLEKLRIDGEHQGVLLWNETPFLTYRYEENVLTAYIPWGTLNAPYNRHILRLFLRCLIKAEMITDIQLDTHLLFNNRKERIFFTLDCKNGNFYIYVPYSSSKYAKNATQLHIQLETQLFELKQRIPKSWWLIEEQLLRRSIHINKKGFHHVIFSEHKK